jgi:hypothetical protein
MQKKYHKVKIQIYERESDLSQLVCWSWKNRTQTHVIFYASIVTFIVSVRVVVSTKIYLFYFFPISLDYPTTPSNRYRIVLKDLFYLSIPCLYFIYGGVLTR